MINKNVYLQGTRLYKSVQNKSLATPMLVVIGFYFIAGMHLYLPNIGGSGLMLPFNSFGWLIVSIVIGIGFLSVSYWHKLYYSQLTQILFLAAICFTIPIFYKAAIFSKVLPRILAIWGAFLFFVALQQIPFKPKHKKYLLYMIFAGGIIELLWGWTQYLFYGFNHPVGSFLISDFMASFLVTGIILAGYLLTRESFENKKLSWRHYLYLLFPVATIPLLFFISSKLGFISLLFSLTLLWIYQVNFLNKKIQKYWLIALATSLFLACIFLNKDLANVVSAQFTLTSNRISIWYQSLILFIDNLGSGVGYGNFQIKYLIKSAQLHALNPQNFQTADGITHAYNLLLTWCCEGGVIVLVGVIFLLIALVLGLKRINAGTRVAALALLLPILLHMQIDKVYSLSIAHLITILVLVYWIDSLAHGFYIVEVKLPVKSKKIVIAAITIITIFLVTNIITGVFVDRLVNGNLSANQFRSKILNKVVWQESVDEYLFNKKLYDGIYNKNFFKVKEYIKWALKYAAKNPSSTIYNNLILANRFIGSTKQAKIIEQEAIYLFENKNLL